MRTSSLPWCAALLTLLFAGSARAQSVDPRATGPGAGIPDRAALLSLAGPRGVVRDAEDGTIRMLYGAHVAPWSGDPARDALALAGRFGRALGIAQGADLRVERVRRAHGFTIVRLARHEGGRPVIGASVVVRFLADGAIDLVFADYGPHAVARGATLDAEHALSIARGLELGLAGPVRALGPVAAALATPDEVLPVWRVDVHGAVLSQRMRALIDARDGTLLAAEPLATHARGRVYPSNPTTDMMMPSDVELVDLTSAERLTGSGFRVLDCNAPAGDGCAPAQRAIADAAGDFLYDPEPMSYSDSFAEVSAYHHLTTAAAWHRDTNDYTWTCGGGVMRAIVNYVERGASPYDNAAFSPASGGECGFLLFGQGSRTDFAYDADVVYHEYGHAVTDDVASIAGFLTDGLGVSYESLAINEGSSDYYAGSIQGNAQIAESMAGLGIPGLGSHGSLRVIANEMTCPGSLIGEGHEDGGLWSGVGWDVHEMLGAEISDALVFASVASVTSDPSLAEASELMIATAMGMETMGAIDAAARDTIVGLITARGLPDCQRIIPLDDGEMRTGWSGTEFLTGNLGSSVAPVHYSIAIPADAEILRLRIDRITLTGEYTLHFFVDRPVRVSATRVLAQRVIPVPPGTSIDIDATTDLALPRCRTLYVAVQSNDLRARGQNLFQIRATLLRTGDPAAECPVIEPDAGPATDASPDAGPPPPPSDGCSCRASSRTAPSPLLALLALGLLLRRRR